MKISPEQKIALQKYLRKVLKYRETYAEFYDHILTAVEAEKTDSTFDDVVITTIKNDFGGVKELRLIENEYKLSVFKELKRKYLDFAMDNFRFPGVFSTIILTVLIYILVKQPWFSLEIFLWNVLAIRCIPWILFAMINIRSAWTNGAPQKSIKSDFFKWQNFIAVFIFLAAISMTSSGNFGNPAWFQKLLVPGAPAMTVLIVLIALHSLTYYKVCREDIKTSLKTR